MEGTSTRPAAPAPAAAPLLLPEDITAITKAVQQRLVRIAFAGVVQVAQARLELTELEARCRRLEIELRFANENRMVLAAEACCDADSLTLDETGPSYAELTAPFGSSLQDSCGGPH